MTANHVIKCAGTADTYKRLAKVVGVMAFAGFTAGLLGIGGALIFNPVLLQLGVQPQVSSLLRKDSSPSRKLQDPGASQDSGCSGRSHMPQP